MTELRCPVCGGELIKNEKTMTCPAGHSFDISRQGYVNLLMSNSSSKKRHGDDRLMVSSRYDFLNKGYYMPVRQGVEHLLENALEENALIIDAGCGECWYTAAAYEHLAALGRAPRVIAADISKEALKYGSRRSKALTLTVSSVSALPVGDGAADGVMSIFAPFVPGEFGRVLKKGGYLLRAVPLERHLFSLKAAVYDRPYLNDPVETEVEGFELCDRLDICEQIHLECSEDVKNLFMMTPYYYKTGKRDQEKLEHIDKLDTELCVALLGYRKI